jgi:hypothetical protein
LGKRQSEGSSKMSRSFRSWWLARSLLALSVGSSLVVFESRAAETWHTSTIKWVYPQADGAVVVLVFHADSAACSAQSPKYHYAAVGQNGMTAEGLKLLAATALSAAAQGRTVSVAFDSASGGCYINRMLVVYD